MNVDRSVAVYLTLVVFWLIIPRIVVNEWSDVLVGAKIVVIEI
jgi:hypothetical protein